LSKHHSAPTSQQTVYRTYWEIFRTLAPGRNRCV